MLFIDGAKIIDNDGLHTAPTQASGTLELTAGFHRIRCDYFDAVRNKACILEWQPPGSPRQIIPANFFFLSLPEHKALEESIDRDQDYWRNPADDHGDFSQTAPQ